MKKEYHSRLERKKQRKKRLFVVLIFLLLLITLSTFFVIMLQPHETKEKRKEEKPQEPKEINQEFSLIAVGDALIHDGVYNDANTGKKGSDGYATYSFSKMFPYIKEVIKDYDLKFYNQETIIGGKQLGVSSYPRFNSPDEIGLDMINTGFNLVNLATNHTLDKGEKAILYSRNFWNKQNVYAVGSYSSPQERDNVVIKNQNGITYSLLGYTVSTNGIPVPEGKDYLINVYNQEKVKQDIEKVRDKVDVLIVSMHWGTEYTNVPTEEQRKIASYLSSLGVDVIIGHHPHVIQPIEFVNNTLVIYSLGNFISAQDGNNKRVGMIAAFKIHKKEKGEEKVITIEDVKGDLLWTYHKGYRQFKVIPFSKLNRDLLSDYQAIYKEYSEIINKTKDSRIQTGFIK